MFNQIETQGTITKTSVDDYLLTWFEAFLIDRKARGLANGTLRFYRIKLKLFSYFCETQVVTHIHQITTTLIRLYLLYLEETGHNEGGRHTAYRTLRAFLYWYEDEVEPEGWKNPIRKVKAPKVPTEPIDPVPIGVVSKADNAEVIEPSLHDFRRAFCLAMLREGTDIFTLAKLMGHESTAVLQRYLKQTNQDTERAHRRAGPVDNANL
ncbi:tyrosine-type recombinase/integrase [Chloroflexota bacterium]